MDFRYLLKRVAPSLLILISIILTGCGGQGPEKASQYATQGLLSGAISKDGKYAVIGSLRNGGSLWDIKGFKRKYDWNHKAKTQSLIRSVAISGDGKRAITTEEDTMVVWDTITGKSVKFLKTPSRVLAVALSQDGRYALAGMRDNLAMYFDLATGVRQFTFDHQAEVRSVGISEDGKMAITAGDDMVAKIWELSKGTLVKTFTHNNQIKTAAISPKGRYAFTTAQRESSTIWDLNTGKAKFSLPNRYTNYTTVAFSKDGKSLLVGTFQGLIEKISVQTGKVVKKWEAKQRKTFGRASKAIISVGFSYQKGHVLALTSDGMLESFAP